MSVIIIKPGALDTIQDLGRSGQGMYGVNPGGAMDRFATRMANILVGNDTGEAVVEIHFPGPQLLFTQDVLISVTGADFSPTLNDESLPAWKPVFIKKNNILQFFEKRAGTTVYLAVHGGFRLEKWLNSYSTNLKASAGGWQGRRLQKGDELLFRSNKELPSLLPGQGNFHMLPWRPDVSRVYQEPGNIFFIPGNEYEELTGNSIKDLVQDAFIVQPSSDRMGYQLKGASLSMTEKREMISSAVSFGTMQLLPSGQMIILMADHQTTGGYPRVGHVISAHLPKLAQLSPHSSIRFRPVNISEAEEILISQQKQLLISQRACQDHLNAFYAKYRS